MGVILEFNQSSKQKYCQFGLKGQKSGQKWRERLSDFWDSAGQANRAIQFWICIIPQEKGRRKLKMAQKLAGCHCHHRPDSIGQGRGLSPPWFHRWNGCPGSQGWGCSCPGLRGYHCHCHFGPRRQDHHHLRGIGGRVAKDRASSQSRLFWALNSNEFVLVDFRIVLDLWPLSSDFPLSEWDVYPMSVPSLYFGSKYVTFWFHRFIAREKFCLRANHSSSLMHAWFMWYLDELLDLELMLEWVKTFGM